MSISKALNTAGSGLLAAARAIQVSSSNVANGLSPGYAPRALNLVASSVGGSGTGVRITGIDRQTDPVLAALLRDSAASMAAADHRAAFWSSIEAGLGLPGEAGSLSALLDDFTSALIGAADRPDLDSRLQDVVRRAGILVAKFGALETSIQSRRNEAEASIAADARQLEEGLARLHRINVDIAVLSASDHARAALADERDALLESLSEIVPLSIRNRSDGQVTVYTKGGLVLLDLKPARIEFSPVPAISATMSLSSGDLSGITVNGQVVSTDRTGPMGGGRLAAAFSVRDTEAPAAQAAIDQLAEGLIARFEDPATDPSLAPSAPALFTLAGSPLGSAAGTPGLAGQLALNTTVLPSAGGQLWRLRDGLGAAAPGPVGNASQLQRLLQALDRPVQATPGSPAATMAQDVAGLLSSLGKESQAAQERVTVAAVMQTALSHQRLENGVDVDAEMRRLLEIETAYAANARVIQIADDMLRRLLEI